MPVDFYDRINLPDNPTNYGDEARGMFLRFKASEFGESTPEPVVKNDPDEVYVGDFDEDEEDDAEKPGILNTITVGEGNAITIQGVIEDPDNDGEQINWSYSQPAPASGNNVLTIKSTLKSSNPPNTAVAAYLLENGFANVKIWAEKSKDGLLLASEAAWGSELEGDDDETGDEDPSSPDDTAQLRAVPTVTGTISQASGFGGAKRKSSHGDYCYRRRTKRDW